VSGPAGVKSGTFGVQAGNATGPGALTTACTLARALASSFSSSSMTFFTSGICIPIFLAASAACMKIASVSLSAS
jgi:hypothetical protein